MPRVGLPLGAAFVALALACAGTAWAGRRARERELTFAAAVATGAALDSIPVYGFGSMLCLGLLGGWFLCAALAERDGLPREAVAGAYVAAAVAGLAGARLLYVLTNLGDFGDLGEMLAFRNGGLVF